MMFRLLSHRDIEPFFSTPALGTCPKPNDPAVLLHPLDWKDHSRKRQQNSKLLLTLVRSESAQNSHYTEA